MLRIFRFSILLGVGLAGAIWAGPAISGEDTLPAEFAGFNAVPEGDLLGVTGSVSDSFNVNITNDSDINGTMEGNVIEGNDIDTGAITGTVLRDNAGITTVLQNTGNQVNMGASVNVNVYLH
ncbi:MAG: hypothetical protein IMF05_12750 [Proteobacteria bacterium]|nr:hypothetical protein [Pseudomonadota bacterium]